MKQQCKAEWIGFGDECSRLFMARIKQRKVMASIYFIKGHDDQRFKGFEAVSTVLTDYYKDLLGNSNHHRTGIDTRIIEMGPTLTIDQQLYLYKPFEDADIKDVFFSIPNYKSPGPDGYNSGFFKACWDGIGSLVCSAIKEFFSEGQLPSFCGQTKLILLPKVANPKKA